MKTFRVIVNSSMRQSTTPWSGDGEGARAVLPRGWPGMSGEDWRLCAWVVHYDSVDSPIRCAAFTTERSCQSVWKVRPVANCDLSRGKTRWSRLTAREKGGAWRSVQGANVFGTFAIHIAIRASRGLGDEMQKCLNLFNFTHKEILIESVALKREFYKRQKFAGLENTRYFLSNILYLNRNTCLKKLLLCIKFVRSQKVIFLTKFLYGIHSRI